MDIQVVVKDEPCSDEDSITIHESELETIDNIRKFIQDTDTIKKFSPPATRNNSPRLKNEHSQTDEHTVVNSRLTKKLKTHDTFEQQTETITIVYENDDDPQEYEYKIIIEADQLIKVEEPLVDGDSDKEAETDTTERNKCLKCRKSFRSLGELRRHQRTMHFKTRKGVRKQSKGFGKGKMTRLKSARLKAPFGRRSANKVDGGDSEKSKFRCNRCHIHYNTFEELACHRVTPEHNRSIACDICHQSFKYKYLMKLHRNNHIKTEQRLLIDYHCIPCEIKLNTFPKVLLHYEEKHSADRNCILCGVIVRQGYKKHLKAHRKRVYKCLPCNKVFNSNAELIQHYHSDEHKEMKRCKVCNEVFPNPARVRIHMITRHKMGKIQQCELCGVTCGTVATLNRHKKRKHLTDQMVLCELCGKAFFTKTAVRNHITDHHINRPKMCYICLKEFKQDEELEEHYPEHEEHAALTSKYSCESCDMDFQSERHTFEHILAKHSMYACYKCLKLFSQKRGLKYHLVTHEYSQNIEITQAGVICLVCRKTFKYKSSLRYHMYCHTGEKPYQCDVCKKIFRKPYHVKLHMRTHTKERPYSCDKCDKRFTSKPAIKYHLTQVHSTDPRLHQCSVCLRKFKSEFLCKGHIARMHSGDARTKPQAAKDDILNVRLPPRLKNKIRLEEYKCNFCIRTFKSEHACINHSKRYHPQESADLEEIDIREILDPRRKDCLYCHRYFKSESAFSNHMVRAHPQHIVQEEEDVAGEEDDGEPEVVYNEEVEEAEAENADAYPEDEDEPMEIVLDATVENILRQNGGVIIQEYVEDSDDE